MKGGTICGKISKLALFSKGQFEKLQLFGGGSQKCKTTSLDQKQHL